MQLILLKPHQKIPTRDIYSLDIETAPCMPTDKPYALEPYRVYSDQSKITAFGVYGPKGIVVSTHYKQEDFVDQMRKALTDLAGEEVYCTNTVFDTSFLMAIFGIDIMRPIKWRDTSILNKWLLNGQKADDNRTSYSLAASAGRHCRDHLRLEEFLDIKKKEVKAGDDFEYWLERNKLDIEMTYFVAKKLLSHMTVKMNRGYVVTCNAILPIAQGYLMGIPVDIDSLKKYERGVLIRQQEILKELKIPGTVITSNKQLANLLFNEWGLSPIGYTPKGAPSTSAENLQRLHQANQGVELDLIMEYKKLATMLSKYVNGFSRSIEYLGTNVIHSQPRILSTITGRQTYTTKFFKKNDWQTSIALHQLPRKEKDTKRALIAPKGYKVFYFDFSAQESRVIADVANEETMLEAYKKGMDLHSVLTETIFGTPYEVIVKANIEGVPVDIVDQRQAGKLTGLSSLYRIGAKSLAAKFFSTYGYDISIQTGQSYLTSFKRTYPGIVRYWKDAIRKARNAGYAEAYGGWRYRIQKFDWRGESSSINHPIQGGASMLTYAAIAIISKKWPDIIMVASVHDSLTYFILEEGHREIAYDVIKFLNNYDYGELLGFNAKLKFPVDGAVGDNFADLEAVIV